jgi:hypothetical protein
MERRLNTKNIKVSGRRKTDLAQASLNQRFMDEIEALKRNDEETKAQNAHNHEEIMTLLKPISETYNVATRLGRWLTGGAVFVSIIIGIVVGLQKIFHK